MKRRARTQPSWIAPMLATLVAKPFSDSDWIFEPKLDGVRCLVYRDGGTPHLFSRNRIALNGTYPELIEPLTKRCPESYIADGEVVAFKDGVPSFTRLQRRMQVRDPTEARRRGVAVAYYLFDLLYLDGADLRETPLVERKAMLKKNFRFRAPLDFVEHRSGDGEAFFREMCRARWEGMVAKRAASVYISRRSRDWLKVRCSLEQELVIAGYTDPAGERAGLGALLLGYYDAGGLRYAGKVGTGFDTRTLLDLARTLSALETTKPTFSEPVPAKKGVHWVKPKLVAQIAFTEWTREGRLRHPRFLGLRRDKKPREVVRERPQ